MVVWGASRDCRLGFSVLIWRCTAMRVKSISLVVSRWLSGVAGAGGAYEAGVRAPSVDWATVTVAAESVWGTAVAAAVAAKSFSRGVSACGTGGWQRGCLEKGLARWSPGVNAASGLYQAKFSPFLDALAALTLQPRRPKRDPANLQRVAQVVNTMIRVATGVAGRTPSI